MPLFFNPDMFYGNLPFVIQLAIQVPVAILFTWVFNSTGGSVLLAILLHASINASGQLWKVMPEYSVQPPSAAEAATTHMNLIVAIVVGAAALVVVLVYGPRNLSRHPREVSSAPDVESSESRPPRVR